MAKGVLATFSFIMILLSLLCFIMPVFIGSSSVIFFFLVSFGLLIFALFTSMASLIEGGDGLALFSFIVSLMFLLFLVVGALLQV